MTTSLGVIETRGLTPAIHAADAACKSAAVNLVGYKKIGSGLVSVMFHGEISAISAAVENGVEAAQGVVASLVIARPDESVLAMLENTSPAQPEPVADADCEPAPKADTSAPKVDTATPEKAQPAPEVLVKSEQKPEPEQKAEPTATKGPEAAQETEPKPETSRKATGDKPAAKRSTRTRKQGPRK